MILDKVERSEFMKKIRSKNTAPEIIVRKYLFSKGLRFRIHNKKMIGKPDIVLPKYQTAVFINGCFWHAHKDCKFNKLPKSNRGYWVPKILGNAERDKINTRQLRKMGWKTITIWECELKIAKKEKTLTRLYRKIIDQAIQK